MESCPSSKSSLKGSPPRASAWYTIGLWRSATIVFTLYTFPMIINPLNDVFDTVFQILIGFLTCLMNVTFTQLTEMQFVKKKKTQFIHGTGNEIFS